MSKKLTSADVKVIRELIEQRENWRKQAAQYTNERIAEKFGVHRRTIENISAQLSWVHN